MKHRITRISALMLSACMLVCLVPFASVANATAEAADLGSGVLSTEYSDKTWGDFTTQRIDISGEWDFVPFTGASAAMPSYPAGSDYVAYPGAAEVTGVQGAPTKIMVPGGGWGKQGHLSSATAGQGVTRGIYSTDISIPAADAEPQKYVIAFSAVNCEAIMSIKEAADPPSSYVVVGRNMTTFTSQEFDITDFVVPGMSYTIQVDVRSHDYFRQPTNSQPFNGRKWTVPVVADWSRDFAKGIFGSYAELRLYNQVYISDTFIRTSVSDQTLAYDVYITNTTSSPQSVTIKGSINSWNGASWQYPSIADMTVTVPANTTSRYTVGPLAWIAGPDSFWWPNVPYEEGYFAQLHNLALTLEYSSTIAEAAVRFGFREITQNGSKYNLNGKDINLRMDSLQITNYDRVVHDGGRGDAVHTLPGFGPPTADNRGWPGAVDNYLRLNYNSVRIHQQPCSPYMLDVCDEMGLLIIDETGIRNSSNGQDIYSEEGKANCISHLEDLVLRDRNHPSVIRWALFNEVDSTRDGLNPGFVRSCYDAVKALDETRPISNESNYSYYNIIDTDDFASFPHYITYGTSGMYAGYPDKPYGCGELLWPRCSSLQGFTEFGTLTQLMRYGGSANISPYTLLSAWSSLIPGVLTSQYITEESTTPLFGENNLPDPWSNELFQRVQAGFNPLLVADQDYWKDKPGARGDWPSGRFDYTIPYGQAVTRVLTVYNDTLGDENVTVKWEARLDSPSGRVVASDTLNLSIRNAYYLDVPITFTAPKTGSKLYLILESYKEGKLIFREDKQVFNLGDIYTASVETILAHNRGTELGQWQLSAGWSTINVAQWPNVNGSCYTTTTQGATATLTFYGDRIVIIGASGQRDGLATVTLNDEEPVQVSFFEDVIGGYTMIIPPAYGKVVYDSGLLERGEHTIVVTSLRTKDPANPSSGNQFNVTLEGADVYLYEKRVAEAIPTASVDQLNGNQNRLHIRVREVFFDGTLGEEYYEVFMINNNAAAQYKVGPYTVYVDTKGNTQIRACVIVAGP